MSSADVAIGIMEGAYFTGRNELLTFFNTTFNLNLTKIEQTASGAVACQLTEYLFPGSIAMSKVNWGGRSDHEYIGNYKLLQKAFAKNRIQRYVDVDKLIRGKYQDNLEFCQWLKAFFDMKVGTAASSGGGVGSVREDYDAVAVRARGKGGKSVPTYSGGGKKSLANNNSGRSRAPTVRSTSSGRGIGNNAPTVGKARIGSSSSASLSNGRTAAASGTTSSTSTSRGGVVRTTSTSSSSTIIASSTTSTTTRSMTRPTTAVTQKENNKAATNNNLLPTTTSSRKSTPTTTTINTAPSSSAAAAVAQQIKKYQEEITQLKSQNTHLQTKYSNLQLHTTELEHVIETTESERDFYFEKLRGIEVMLQVYKEREESGEMIENDESSSSSVEMKRVMDKIFKVMYATAEDQVGVDDEGNLVGDITFDESLAIDESLGQSNVSMEGIRPHAQDELVHEEEVKDDQDDENEEEVLLTSDIIEPAEVVVEEAPAEDNDDDDEELLTTGIIEPVEIVVEAPAEDNDDNLVQFSDEDDDEELLTSGIISPVNEVKLVENEEDIANQLLPDFDDDDEELLTSGIDSGDDEGAVDSSTRSAENARIISQLVADAEEDDIGDVDLLADDDDDVASQDEY